jgi:hypothetical protein
MNQLRALPLSVDREALQARFARRIVARLNEDANSLGADISERLRFAREGALARSRLAVAAQAAPALGRTSAGAVLLGFTSTWGFKLASALPLIALVSGLVLIQHWQARAQISVAAEVDASLLADDLPPTAYSDAGFVEFLKMPPSE